MNFKTTLVLLVLAAAGGVLYWVGPSVPVWVGLASPEPDVAGAGTLNILENELTPQKVSRVEVQRGDRRVVLERGADGEWTLPGRWPTRKPEVEQFVGLLTGLRSRFTPEPLADEAADLKTYGLDQPAAVVLVRAGKEYRLAFGEKQEAGEGNRFSRPTYVRVDNNPEVIRLAPGLIAAFDRPLDYYQQRRLFPSERVVKEAGSQEKVERLAAKTIAVKDPKNPASSYTLTGSGEDWELRDPVHDRVDPDKLKSLLAAVPDVWAEQFVDKPKSDLAEYGLKDPEQTLSITRPGGATVTLLVGKPSQVKTRTVVKPAPPFGPPMPPQRDIVHEEYRYAKLQDNDQIFEVQGEKLKDVFVAADTLRDARLARFRTEDARRLELTQAGQEIVLVKDKERWRLQKPLEADAETSKVTELLDKLSGLQARDKDVIDKADPKMYGLDKPAGTVKVVVEEEVKGDGDAKSKKTKTFQFTLGQPEKPPAADKPKIYVRVDGWERVNALEDTSLLTLVKRPALAYRGRRVLDVVTSDLDKIEVQRPGETVALKQDKGVWRLTAPAAAEADAGKAIKLAGDLGNLEAVEYVSEAPKPEDLDTQYGLAKPGLSATLTFTDAKKPAQTLQVGKQRESKPEYFAKLASAPGVFVIKKELHDTLDQASLAYLPLQLVTMQPEDVAAVRIQKEGQEEYRLTHEGPDWRISGPFEAAARPGVGQTMAGELANLRAERYEAHTAKEPEKYGLDKPYLRVALASAEKKEAAPAKEEPKKEPAKEKERVLLIGKPTDKDARTRFAKLADGDAVFVVGEKLVAAVDHGALDLLNGSLLTVDPRTVDRLENKGGEQTLVLERKGDAWQVVESPAMQVPADQDSVTAVLGLWSNLRAQRFAAYGSKAEPAKYGLDKPERTLSIRLQSPAAAEGKKPEPGSHTLALGKPVEGASGERYARLDNGPGVAVLDAALVKELSKGYLDFVNRTLLTLDAAKVTSVQRRMGADTVEIVKRDDSWQLTKPVEMAADDIMLQQLVDQLSNLRARSVAAYPAKDLKPFGLDEPAAVLTLRLAGPDGKATDHVLKVGKAAEEATGDRFVVVEGAQTVGVLSAKLSRRLTADAIAFRNHNVAKFLDADRAVLERGPRKAVFAKVDGTWKLTEPLEAPAEQTELDDLINVLAKLRADELVADKPADLKPYGLDKPEARWRFESGGKEVLSLLVGSRDKDGQRAYAKLAAGDLVFLLSPQLTGKVLGEYRDRSVWTTPPDAAQAETIRYGYLRDPFTLEKIDNVWQANGKSEGSVKQEAVSDMLAALAGLRAARYVVDKGADLKLYGLEPPELVLEVQTKTGKRALHVGRAEGDSKRYYAQVPEKDRTNVFILSEADAAGIVRPLAGFLQEPAKPSKPAP